MPLTWTGNSGILTLSPDSPAADYIKAVEDADGQALEPAVKASYDRFILGCKADGIWDAIKACCIMAGARTLAGALVPLVGTAPTNNNFVSGDYDRVTGLKGDASSKHLDSNRNNNADPQNSKHISVYRTSPATIASLLLATTNTEGRSCLIDFSPGISVRVNSFAVSLSAGNGTGFIGGSRSTSTTSIRRVDGISTPESITSEVPLDESLGVFATSGAGGAPVYSFTDAGLSFYSIGEALDLALLDNRVSQLMTDLGAAIP